ncbi:MAG: hypothetical protein QM706_01215 [Nitrospira sp.]
MHQTTNCGTGSLAGKHLFAERDASRAQIHLTVSGSSAMGTREQVGNCQSSDTPWSRA